MEFAVELAGCPKRRSCEIVRQSPCQQTSQSKDCLSTNQTGVDQDSQVAPKVQRIKRSAFCYPLARLCPLMESGVCKSDLPSDTSKFPWLFLKLGILPYDNAGITVCQHSIDCIIGQAPTYSRNVFLLITGALGRTSVYRDRRKISESDWSIMGQARYCLTAVANIDAARGHSDKMIR